MGSIWNMNVDWSYIYFLIIYYLYHHDEIANVILCWVEFSKYLRLVVDVLQAVKRAVVSVILTWEEWICQSLMKYWIQSTSCTQMKLSSVASPEDLLKLLNILAKSSQSVISWYLTESTVKPSSFHKCLRHEFQPRPSHCQCNA